jgi:hypothetical protein
VNARTGRIISFDSRDVGQLPDLAARIDRDEAISIARSKTPFTANMSVKATLGAGRTESGAPILRWWVELVGSPSGTVRTAGVSIDAKTGEVLATEIR